jgi:ribonuclease BN (tRNA processing enzyme)
MTLTFLGTGDAFSAGGRFQTAFHLRAGKFQALIDCGTTTLTALHAHGLDAAAIEAVLVSHLHGDHFGGVPFLLMDARYGSTRTTPLVVCGPKGIEARVMDTLGCLYDGAPAKVRARVPFAFVEHRDRQPSRIGPIQVLPVPVVHPSGSTSYGLRMTVEGRIIAFSGDTAWTAALVELADGADLFICECFAFETPVPFHLNHTVLRESRERLHAKRIILTHLGRAALERIAEFEFEVAHDGQTIAWNT